MRIPAEAVLWLQGLVEAEVVGQSFVLVTYALATVCSVSYCIQSLAQMCNT